MDRHSIAGHSCESTESAKAQQHQPQLAGSGISRGVFLQQTAMIGVHNASDGRDSSGGILWVTARVVQWSSSSI